MQWTVPRRPAVTYSGVPPFAGRTVLTIAAVVAVAHFAASFSSGYWFDEMYMLALGRNHLDWGSADQPPVTLLLAALMDWIAPGSVVVLRLPAILATSVAVVIAALVAREFGGDRRAQVMTAGAQATMLWITMAGHWLTPYTLEPVQWLALAWLLVRWLRLRDDRLLLALGAVAGLAAETKFQVVLLCAVLLLTALVLGPRDLLRKPMLWAGVAVGALLALPTLLWQAFHGWPQLKMSGVLAAEGEALYGGRPGIAMLMVVLAGIAGAGLSLYGIWWLLRAEEMRSYRFLAVTVLVLYVFFIITSGRPYYLNGAYGILAAAGAVGLQRRREAGQRRWSWVVWPVYALSTALAIALLSITPSLAGSEVGERIARDTAAAYHALPPDQREHTAILGQSYIVAAYLDGYAADHGLPNSYSSNRGYGYRPPPREDQDSALYVGSRPDEMRPHFTEVRQVGKVGDDMGVWLCTGKHEPWSALWPRLRNLTVS